MHKVGLGAEQPRRNVENPLHWLVLMGGGLWGTLRDLPAKAAPVQGAGPLSLVKQKFCTWLQIPCFVPQGYLSASASVESLTGSLAILFISGQKKSYGNKDGS